jgi:hypothetical protein
MLASKHPPNIQMPFCLLNTKAFSDKLHLRLTSALNRLCLIAPLLGWLISWGHNRGKTHEYQRNHQLVYGGA